MTKLSPPRELNFSAMSLSEEWRRWEKSFKNYYAAAELSEKARSTQVAILLNCAGEEARDIFDSFNLNVEDDDATCDAVLQRFRTYCNPKKRPAFESYKFWQRQQSEDEPFDKWLMELRIIGRNCEFGTTFDRQLRDKILFGVRDDVARQRMLEEEELTLEKAINICHSLEATKARLHFMADKTKRTELSVNAIQKKHQATSSFTNQPRQKPCFYCGAVHEPRRCPAFGKQCHKCGKRNHFAAVCQRRMINEITTEQPADEDEAFLQIHSLLERGQRTKMRSNLTVKDNNFRSFEIEFKLDTGAEANVLPYSIYSEMCLGPLHNCSTVLCGFGNAMVKPLGTTFLDVFDRQGERFRLSFYVCKVVQIPILDEHACELLNLVKKIEDISPNKVPVVPVRFPLTLDNIKHHYREVFSGTGLYKQKYHISLKNEITPVVQPPRHIAYALRPKLKAALDDLTRKGIVSDVDGPTDWVSNLVVVEKKDMSLRLCLDPKPLNLAILRERFVIPTPADVQSQLAGKRVFSVIDMKDGYWHVGLTEASSYLTTFHTPWGRKRFLRMPFGICSASEVMQKRNASAFGDIQGVHVIADDIIVAAKDNDEHDKIFLALINRAKEVGVRFNEKKIQFKVNSVHYMGHIVTEDGLKADNEKINAIVNMPDPHDIASLQRLLGMTKYLSQYIPNESIITAPLRALLKKNAKWVWSNEHSTAITELKRLLVSSPVLAFYDVDKTVTLQCDASQYGLGACLLQENKPVAFASRALSPAEKNYAQIEKELLAIVFAAEKFHQYVYGKPSVIVHSDHKPLEYIWKKPLGKTPPRLQRLMLRLQPYDLIIRYVPGKYMYMADTLSRAPLVSTVSSSDIDEDLVQVVHSLVTNLPVTTTNLDTIKRETAADGILQKVKAFCLSGWPRSIKNVPQPVRPFWHKRDVLHVADDIVFADQRIVVPAALQTQMLALIHESHFGIEKSKSRARELLYWPSMCADIERIVSQCELCIKYQNNNPREPLISHDIPNARFLKVAMDIMTYKNQDYLVIVDYFSKYPEMIALTDKTASTIVLQCKNVFARHGIPAEIVSDNMPFNSREFLTFAKSWGIMTTTSSPTYSQSNGQAERFVQTLKRILKKATDLREDPFLALLEYRNTPVSGMKYSPAQILFSRRLRTKLPIATSLLSPVVVDPSFDLIRNQARQKRYYDRRGVKPLPSLKRGDVVCYRKNNMWQKSDVVKDCKEPRSYMIRRTNDCGLLRRNRRHLYKANLERPEFNRPFCNYRSSQQVPTAANTPIHNSVLLENAPSNSSSNMPVRTSRYGRPIKFPSKYSDYVV